MFARLCSVLALACLAACSLHAQDDPPEVTIGERLFLETRFAQFFAANSAGNANATLAAGDPALDTSVTLGTAQPGPFKGQSMNCRACHIVDELNGALGNRTYCDFARRSPIPDRGDGLTTTPRNSPPLVNATITRPGGILLHFDGQFASGQELVVGTLTGRNYGWLPMEKAQAIAHIGHIIRDDDGTGDLAADYGNASYRKIFLGTAADIPAEFRLPVGYRLDVTKATDAQIVQGIGRLVGAYVVSLTFSRNAQNQNNGSPYDVFLRKNNLPRTPNGKEQPIDYARRLRTAVNALAAPKFVSNADQTFTVHSTNFTFDAAELAGLKIFLREPLTSPPAVAEIAKGGRGNCVTCHAPPDFTDFKFHNTGASQEEYDGIHGAGAFARMIIPMLPDRRANPDAWLPPTPLHPYAAGPFLSIPEASHPERVDLGLWNVFANSDFPLPQARLLAALGTTNNIAAQVLPLTIARFKTPGLRDLADSQPYLHNGSKDTIEDVIEFYRTFSALSRLHGVRNADSQIPRIELAPADTAPLAAFLRSLTEDYE